MRPLLVGALLIHAGPAHGDGWHTSISAGGSLLATGEGSGSRFRLDGELDVTYLHYGGLLAIRGADDTHSGLLSLGFVYTAAAARPRLVLDLHGDAGIDLDVHAPVVGGGLRTTITVIGPLGVALDAGLYIVVDGIDQSRAVIDLSAMLALGF